MVFCSSWNFQKKNWMNFVMEFPKNEFMLSRNFQKNLNECCQGIFKIWMNAIMEFTITIWMNVVIEITKKWIHVVMDFPKKIWMNAVMEFHKNMNECFHGISQKYEWMLSWNFTKIWMNVVLDLNKWMMS